MRTNVTILGTAAMIGLLIGAGSTVSWPSFGTEAAGEPIAGCRVTDGDTIRCGDERVRLLGIDAPELPGHCRSGRNCVEGDGHASSASLGEALVGPLTIERVGQDRYGRTLATVTGAEGDLSCWQLARGQAQYVARWDNGRRVQRRCPGAI